MKGKRAGKTARRLLARARFRADPSELQRIEEFAESIPFLQGDERDRLKIVASEILDNIFSHSSRLRFRTVAVSVSKGSSLTLSFRFKSGNFSRFARNERESERRYFDEEAGRYRGLGLAMCRNLSRSMSFRPGLFVDSVVIRL